MLCLKNGNLRTVIFSAKSLPQKCHINILLRTNILINVKLEMNMHHLRLRGNAIPAGRASPLSDFDKIFCR